MDDIEVKSLNSARALKENDNRRISPLEVLAEAYQDIKGGITKADKLLVIALDTSDDNYETQFFLSKLKTSEAITLLAVVQQTFLDIITGKRDA